jgi:hypothetical protein
MLRLGRGDERIDFSRRRIRGLAPGLRCRKRLERTFGVVMSRVVVER